MYLTYSRRNAPLPENVKDVFDEESYKKNQAYKMEKIKFAILSSAVSIAITLIFLLLNFHHALFVYISEFTGNLYLTSLFILLVPVLISGIIGILINIYDVFVIEAKFGFNKTSVKTYIADFIKEILIIFIVFGGLLSLFLLLYSIIGNWVFPAFFFVLGAFTIFVFFISPLLNRLFYKFTPLKDCDLKDKIEKMAVKTGYKLKGIYTVDGSRRSSKLNAFASGFGKTKTIGLFDTLLEKMTDDEIIAVLAHEIGHAKKAHIPKLLFPNFFKFGILLLAAYFIITMPAVSIAFGFTGINLAFGIYILFIMISPVSILLQIPSMALSRKFEYEADAFAKEHSNKEVMISALKKLNRENMGNLTPHPFVVMIEYTHPPLSERIAALVGCNS